MLAVIMEGIACEYSDDKTDQFASVVKNMLGLEATIDLHT